MVMLSKYTSSLLFYGLYPLDARKRTCHCSSQLVWYKLLSLSSLVLCFHPTSFPPFHLSNFPPYFHPPSPSSSFPYSMNKHPTSLYHPSIVVILILILIPPIIIWMQQAPSAACTTWFPQLQQGRYSTWLNSHCVQHVLSLDPKGIKNPSNQ